MLKELDTVDLTRDIYEYGLRRGDIGAIVHRYENGAAFEVEFVTADGKTIALLTLDRTSIRPIGGREILHVRELSEVARV
ncbi:DUF4926 domain-containing protein [Candidatus Poribacteria bacterium]|nr:DUF4926 domain-containing protein [Candidatus Poribacteria bacterium]